MTDCTKEASDAGTKEAHDRNDELAAQDRQRINHAWVDVTIQEITADTVVLTTAGEDNQKHIYRIPKSQVWLKCPSTATADGDVGVLLISKQGLETRSDDDVGVRILGSTPDATGQTDLKIKWPDSGATRANVAPDIESLSIWPTSIRVTGYALDDPDFHSGTVELLDPRIAGFEQHIDLNRGTEITLKLTPKGLGEFQMGGDLDDLRRAVKFVQTPVHDDARHRAEAWSLIARYRRFSDWLRDRDDSKRLVIQEIDLVMSRLPA